MSTLFEEVSVKSSSFLSKKSTNTMEAQKFIDYDYSNHANERMIKQMIYKKKEVNF